MKKQPLFCNGRFYNHEKDSIKLRMAHALKMFLKSLPRLMFGKSSTKPTMVEFESVQYDTCESERRSSCLWSITWIGHSTFLIQIDGINILTDPVFNPISKFFPRHTDAGLSIDQLPKIDFILISHNHRDHMDLPSLQALELRDKPTLLVPFGDEGLLKKNGFACVLQKQWWESHKSEASAVEFTFLPAVHWSGRSPFDINKSMWGSWLICVNGIKIYFAGDSAAGDHFEMIGNRFPDINIALMPIGPCEPRSLMAESHLDPQEAINAFLNIDAKYFVPMHWGTFKSGFEDVLHPARELHNLWRSHELSEDGRVLRILKPGQVIDFDEKC